MKQRSRQQQAMHVSRVTIIENLILSAFKLFAGITAHSGAMLSDAVHSASDCVSTVVVMIGVKLAGKDSDKEHPYGHERMECVAAILLAVLLGATGIGVGWSGIHKIMQVNSVPTEPGVLALAAAVISIIVKEAMYWYTRNAAKKLRSGALMADAWHHRSDAFSSVGSFAGILGARLGVPILDPLAGLIICFFIVKAAVSVFLDAVSKMTDHACDEDTQQSLKNLIYDQAGVAGIDRMQTRFFGDRIYVDVEISVNANATLVYAHAVAQQVHDAVEQAFPDVKHCMIHVNPAAAVQTDHPW